MPVSSTRISKTRECEKRTLQCPKKPTKRSYGPYSKDFEILSQLKYQLENLPSLEYDYELVTRVEQLYSKYVKVPLQLKNKKSLPSTVQKGSNTLSIKIQKLYRQTLKKHNLPLNYKINNQENLVLESLEKGDFAKVVFLCQNTSADLKAHYINLTISEQHPETALEILKNIHTQLMGHDLELIAANAARHGFLDIIHFLLDHSLFSTNFCIKALNSFTCHTNFSRLKKSIVMRFLNPKFKTFHPTLINIGLKLGHNFNPKGICLGICSAGNVAIVTGDMKIFNARLKKIFSLHSQHLTQSLNNEEEAIKQTAQVIETNTDLRSFFDTLVSFHQNLNANYLSSLTAGTQKIFLDEEIYSLFGSIKLEVKGGIQSFNLACGIYNFWDFKTDLERLCKYFDEHREDFCNKQSPYLAVNLETTNHVISFGYNVFKKEFILNDSNFLPLKGIKNLDELSEILYRSLSQQDIVFPLDPFKHVMLNFKLISIKKEGRLPPKFEPKSYCSLRRVFESRFIEPKTQQTLLIFASKYGYTDLVISLIQSRADVNHQDLYGLSALISAIQKGRKEIVKTMLAANVDVNQGDQKNITPLMFAAEKNLVDVVKDLLNAGADINQPSIIGITPLMIAAHRGCREVVSTLIKANANINLKDHENRSALYLAIRQGYLDVAKDLIQAGALLDPNSEHDKFLVFCVIDQGSEQLLKALISVGADINQADSVGCTPLMRAVFKGHQNIVRILLSSKANINQKNNAGCTALMFAAVHGQSHIFKDLVDAGADVNVGCSKNVTSLIIAAQKNYFDIVDILINAQAKINVKDTLGRTPLILSIISNNVEIVKKLILSGADVNEADENGFTPLMIAVQKDFREIIQELLDANADINKISKHGTSALLIAVIKDDIELTKKFVRAGANVNQQNEKEITSLMIAVDNNSKTIIQTLLKAKADPNLCRKNGWSPLMFASKKGFDGAAKALICAGANINQPTQDESTPLMIAADNDHKNVVDRLIKAGADVNKSNVNGFTPLMIAAAKGHLEIVAALLAAKANIDYTTSSGWSSLLLAVQRGHSKVVEYLVKSGANIHLKTIQGSSALSLAKDKEAIVKILKNKKS